MRYDHTVYLIKEQDPDPSSTSLNFEGDPKVTKAKANVKRTNINFASGEMYEVTIVRVFGQYDADSIGLDDYDPNDDTTIHKIQKVGCHLMRTDFYIAGSKVTFNAE
ncbi:hypothetical protein [Limosilactobacillus pontis]|uniref:Uncharacterized protein n=1 Tax=Limosilactobacillus pontis TaxID=35787 RepID=A0ABU7SUL9_9LACO